MTHARNPNHALVIHIRAGLPGASERMDALLQSMPCEVLTWTDVYTGLAKLGRLANEPGMRAALQALIMEIDSLSAAEMPFFSFVAKLIPHVPVLVYGARPTSTRVTQACELGAIGWADKDTVTEILDQASLAGDSIDGREPESPPQVAPVRHQLDPRIDPPPSAPISQSGSQEAAAKLQAERGREAVADSDSTITDAERVPARVPWLRYEDSPTRRGPTRVKPSVPDTSKSEEPPKSAVPQNANDESGPLLTEEELRALIGDDISAIAPKEPTRRPPAGHPEREGES